MMRKVLLVFSLIAIHIHSIDARSSKFFHPNGTLILKSEGFYSDGAPMRKGGVVRDPITGKLSLGPEPNDDDYDEDDYEDDEDYDADEDLFETSSTWTAHAETSTWKPVETSTEQPEESSTNGRWTTRAYITTQRTPTNGNKEFKINYLMKFSTLDEAVQMGIWIIIVVVTIFVLCFIFCMIASCTGSETKTVHKNQPYV